MTVQPEQERNKNNIENFTDTSRQHSQEFTAIRDKFLNPITNLPQEGWMVIEIPDDEDGFYRIRVEEYRRQFEQGFNAYIAERGTRSCEFESRFCEFRLHFDDTFTIREYTQEELREYFLQDHEWRFLPEIAHLSDQTLIQISWFPHDGSNSSKGKVYTMTAGQFRANFALAAEKMVNELSHHLDVSMGVFEDGEEVTMDLAYHDIYDIYEYTPEMQACDNELKNLLKVVSELEKLGVPADLFSGEENFFRYGEHDQLLWPEEKPKFTPEEVVGYAKIIISAHTPEMEVGGNQLKNLLEVVSELEKLGVPADLFSGDENFLRYDEHDNFLWPLEKPKFTLQEVVRYARIIEKYLEH